MASSLDSIILEGILPTTSVTIILPAVIIQLLHLKSPDPKARENAVRGLRSCLNMIRKLRDLYAGGDYATGLLDAALRLATYEMKKVDASTAEKEAEKQPPQRSRKQSGGARTSKKTGQPRAKRVEVTQPEVMEKGNSQPQHLGRAVSTMDRTLSLTRDLTQLSRDVETAFLQDMPTPPSTDGSDLVCWDISDTEIEKLLCNEPCVEADNDFAMSEMLRSMVPGSLPEEEVEENDQRTVFNIDMAEVNM